MNKPPRPDLLAAIEREFPTMDAPASWSDKAISRFMRDIAALPTARPQVECDCAHYEAQCEGWSVAYAALERELIDAERSLKRSQSETTFIAFVALIAFIAMLGVIAAVVKGAHGI